jgi:hypothetical protein
MQIFKRHSTTAFLLTALALAPLCQNATADDQLEIKGQQIYVDSTPVSFTFPFSTTLTTAEGKATHLGHFVVVTVTTVNVLNATATGTMRVITDGGDTLFATLTGYALQPFSLKETVADITITGGTGRFEGANGGWRQDSHFDFAVNAGVPVNPYIAYLAGAISKPLHDQ